MHGQTLSSQYDKILEAKLDKIQCMTRDQKLDWIMLKI